MHHFSYGPLTPGLAYLMSYIGSLLGLMGATRARVLTGASRYAWLLMAAVSLGGVGIWVMHFIAMLGFSIDGMSIHFDPLITGASALVAVAAVGGGLVAAGNDPRRLGRIALGGLLCGLGVAAMHYLGMAAMIMPASEHYDPLLFAASVVIAIVAATVALWFTLVIKGRLATGLAAALMGVAVCGMHFTGMAALGVQPDHHASTGGGLGLGEVIGPLIIGVSILTVVLLLFVTFVTPVDELVEDAELAERLGKAASNRPQPVPEPMPQPNVNPAVSRSLLARRSSLR